jgi:hypothetical protein
LLDAIKRAKRTITFSSFQLDRNTEIVKEIIQKAIKNISVSLFCRPIEKQFNEQLKELLEVGVQIYFHPLTHSKSLLIDSKNGFVFTANLVANGLDNGLEIGLKLNEEQTKDLSTIHQSWQDNFPSKAIKVVNLKDLKEIQVFKDRKLTTKILIDDTKAESIKIVKVADLFSFFNQKFDIKDLSTKTLKVKLKAEIEDLPAKYKANGAVKFEVIEVEEDKGKKTKLVVVNSKFELNDIEKIQEWKDLKIYSANA